MKLYSNNIKTIQSQKYQGWYSLKTHLRDVYPDCNIFVVPTTLKGIGKSYSVWNHILIPDIIEKGLGGLYIRWSKDELDLLLENLKHDDSELVAKFPFEVEWSSMKSMSVLRKKDDGRILLIFCSPANFGALKGMTTQGNLPLLNVYWEEFLTTQNIYRKAKATIDSFWQLLGSMFREKPYYVYMTANLVDVDNPFLHFMFNNMGWPEQGETIIDYTAGVVIDSPFQSDMVKEMYKDTTFYKNSKMNSDIHKQLFGVSKTNDSVYANLMMVVSRVEVDVKYQFSVQIKNFVLHIVYYYDELKKKNVLYVTPQNIDTQLKIYSGDLLTARQSTHPLIPINRVGVLVAMMDNKEIYYRDGLTMSLFTQAMSNTRLFQQATNPINWLKK